MTVALQRQCTRTATTTDALNHFFSLATALSQLCVCVLGSIPRARLLQPRTTGSRDGQAILAEVQAVKRYRQIAARVHRSVGGQGRKRMARAVVDGGAGAGSGTSVEQVNEATVVAFRGAPFPPAAMLRVAPALLQLGPLSEDTNPWPWLEVYRALTGLAAEELYPPVTAPPMTPPECTVHRGCVAHRQL